MMPSNPTNDSCVLKSSLVCTAYHSKDLRAPEIHMRFRIIISTPQIRYP